MKKSLSLLRQGFESSSGVTPEFMAFYKTFKSELTAELKKRGCTQIEVGRGHFYCSGFFTAPSGKIYYFSLPDVRGIREGGGHFGSMMYRTAEHYKDYTGGMNRYVELGDGMVSKMNIE